ncbi:MAG TPA: alpha/beta fold hydrolase [Candidatus Limnocylindrales bacterium]|nr:alpha/beta fold hydrolase [Candidatus Limnocylindrales bacterium]
MERPIRASLADLPPAVAAALAAPTDGARGVVEAAGIPFVHRSWGDPSGAPLLLVHGVTASSRTWWRVGPALAAGLGRRVIAVDQAGHGETGHWVGHHRFADNAADIVAFTRAAGLARPDLRVVGHSWGAMTAAALPGAGLPPEVLVLLDPPAIPAASLAAMLDDPVERPYDDLAEALAAVGGLYRTWPYGDVHAKADGLTRFDAAAVRAILLENGDWDGGLAALSDPAARSVATWLVRGEPAAGGLVPDAAAARFRDRLGEGHVLTIAGGNHSPMRLHPEATVLALLLALGADLAAGAEPDVDPAGPGVAERVVSAVGAVVEATVRKFDERPGARVRRVRRLGQQPLPTLDEVHPDAVHRQRRELGVRTIDVSEIAGTAVGGGQRGGDFLPLKPFRSRNWAARWQRLSRAADTLAILPPIDVLRHGDGYWVVDGHNRVAMALYRGQVSIDADVIDLVDPAAATREPAESFASLIDDSRDLRAAIRRPADSAEP